MTANTALA